DAFVAKLNASGSSLVFSTFVGGSGPDICSGMGLDGSGNIYIAGTTTSTDLPATAGAIQPANGRDFDVFVAKLDPAAHQDLYLTYLGGTSAAGLLDVALAVDAAGDAYVTGDTDSPDFPTTPGAVQPHFGGGYEDAFVAKLDPTGTALAYSTFVGGADDDHG